MKWTILPLLLALSCAQVRPTDKALSDDMRQVRASLDSLQNAASPNERMVKAALSLLDKPYVAQTLEVNATESLVINLRELDCTTLIENCLALSRTAQLPEPDFSEFTRQLQLIRYRSGILDGYPSRLHYTTDWIFDNASLGLLEDITHALGGKRFRVQVNFMSSNPDRYPSLKDNPADVSAMAAIEQTINARNTYYYIPKGEIGDKQSLIQSGDIIGFVTRIPGLDISHLGIAFWEKGQLRFIHASTQAMKVIVNPTSIGDYCRSVATCTGIVVLRPTSSLRTWK